MERRKKLIIKQNKKKDLILALQMKFNIVIKVHMNAW